MTATGWGAEPSSLAAVSVDMTSSQVGPTRVRTASRYLAVSFVNLFNHQVLLFTANTWWHWPGGWANVFAAVVAAIPAYFLSRTWVWEVSGRHDFRSEVLPFWLLALAGLVVSTGLAELADRSLGAGLQVNAASLVGYFIVWVAKYLLLDRLFAPATDRA